MFTLLIFLLMPYRQEVEKIPDFVTIEECQKAGEAALKAWKTPQDRNITFVCVSQKK